MFIARSRFIRTAAAVALMTVALMAVLPLPLAAWGDVGHRLIGLTAAQRLPSDV